MSLDAATVQRELADAANLIANGVHASGLTRLGVLRASLGAVPAGERRGIEDVIDRIARAADERAVRQSVRENQDRLARICGHPAAS